MAVNASIETSTLIAETEAARLLGCTPACLKAWRSRGQGPDYVKLGRLVRYMAGDIQRFIEARRIGRRDAGDSGGGK
jgi:predicted DNA-binding transcriptional regulator AlpA